MARSTMTSSDAAAVPGNPERGTLASPVLRLTPAEAELLLLEHYGIEGSARCLAGEKDDNFAVRSAEGEYLLKVLHPDEALETIDLVTAVLLHLAEHGDLPVERIVPALGGLPHSRVPVPAGNSRVLRVTTLLKGRLLRTVPQSRDLEFDVGRTLALLGRQLESFRHPAAERPLVWDIATAHQLRPLLEDLRHLPDHGTLLECLDHFEDVVRPRLAGCRRQMVHNDFSDDNVLVDETGERVAGVIDFNDGLVTELVNDVAIAMSNRLGDGDDPLAAATPLLCGFQRTVALADQELCLLYDLIRTRNAIRIIIAEWRGARFPENRAYIMRNTARARRHLEAMPAFAEPRATAALRAACEASAA
jgi:hydroxylysine kinase